MCTVKLFVYDILHKGFWAGLQKGGGELTYEGMFQNELNADNLRLTSSNIKRRFSFTCLKLFSTQVMKQTLRAQSQRLLYGALLY